METSNVTERKNKRRMRHYTLKRNSERHYASSAPAALNNALKAHRSGLSIRECTEKYKLKRSTLSDKILGKHTKPIGRRVGNSLLFKWVFCGRCGRGYLEICLVGSMGDEECFFVTLIFKFTEQWFRLFLRNVCSFVFVCFMFLRDQLTHLSLQR